MKKIVVFSFLGTQLDAGKGSGRWEKWRPNVAIAQQEDVLISRFELFHSGRTEALLNQVVADIETVSPETTINAIPMEIQDPWDFGEVYSTLFDFARQYAFNTDEEDYWIHITTGTHVAQICLFLMTEARYFPGVLLQTSPARRQRSGDPGSYTLIDLDLSRYNPIAARFEHEREAAVSFLKSGIATRNQRFNRLIEELEYVAVRSRAPMLLTGPTGAGKSYLAKRVYELKRTRHQIAGAFVDVNCATLRGDGAASSLFGHIKGAFTGAATDRLGYLRAANKGLLFLDEIGELGLDEQAMLLKAIEEKRFYPMGSDKEVESDFQLIAGTHRDLRQDVLAGRFREDLFARINLWTYELPGLAARVEDIEPNAEYLLELFSQEHHKRIRFNTEARQQYFAFACSRDAKWMGNFRDLSASITRMATLAGGGRIGVEEVTTEIERLKRQWHLPFEVRDMSLSALLPSDALEKMDLFDRLQLEAVVRVCRESKSLSDAGRKLYAVSRIERSTSNDADRLRKYLKRFDLDWEKI